MFKIALKGLLARKLRLALLLVAIMVGVTWVVGTLVVTDSLSQTFDNLVEDIEGDIDLTVRTRQEFGESFNRPPIDAAVLDTVADIDGIKAAEGRLASFGVTPVKANGDALKSNGPPLIGVNYGIDPDLNQAIQVEGRLPVGLNEFNMDIDTAEDGDFVVGDTYKVAFPAGTFDVTLVGTFAFNSVDNDTVGAKITLYDTPTAQQYFNRVGQFDEIGIVLDDDNQADAVSASISSVLPDGAEVVGRAVKVEEGQADFDEIASIFANVLLGFGAIIVVVVAFLINNTFRIVVGQRIKELALLRAIGATGRQVVSAVILEALLLGVVATVAGFGLGLLFAKGFVSVLNAIGFGLPGASLRIVPRTIIAAVVVGVFVTLAAALLPVLKVRQIPPIAALRDDFRLEGTGLRRRLTTGGMITAIGVILMGLGLFGSFETAQLLTCLAGGALLVFIGVNLLSPAFAVPVARALGAPIAKFRGTAGRLAQENAARSPRRTASTAAALTIGLALVSMTAVVGNSLKESFLSTLDNAVEADYFIRADGADTDPTAGFSPDLTKTLSESPEFESVLPFRFTTKGVKVQDGVKDITGTNFAPLLRHIDPGVINGDIASAGPDSLLVHKDSAEDLGLQVGDSVEMTFVDQQTEMLTVAAIYDDSSILGNWVISLDVWQMHFSRGIDQFVTARVADGVGPEAAKRAVVDATATYPNVIAEDRAEFKKSTQEQLDSFLAVISGFLGLSLILALFGIFNTLQLSVFERTRELGLLRAVGMGRSQVRAMVRWEAVIVAVFGAVLGVVLGVLFGVAVAYALPESFIKSVSIPVGQLISYVVIAAVGGLIAAAIPAWRASRLKVLDAIAHQ